MFNDRKLTGKKIYVALEEEAKTDVLTTGYK
jgi:hypothetical protein